MALGIVRLGILTRSQQMRESQKLQSTRTLTGIGVVKKHRPNHMDAETTR